MFRAVALRRPFFITCFVRRCNCKVGVGCVSCNVPAKLGGCVSRGMPARLWGAPCRLHSCPMPGLLERHRSNLCRRHGANVTGQFLQACRGTGTRNGLQGHCGNVRGSNLCSCSVGCKEAREGPLRRDSE